MDLATFKKIGPDLDREVEAVFAKFGFKMTKRSAGVNAADGTVRWSTVLVDTNLKDADGNATTPEQNRWKQYAEMYGLNPEWLGQKITLNGNGYTIVGLRDTRGGKPVVIQKAGGKTYVVTVDEIIRQLDPETWAARRREEMKRTTTMAEAFGQRPR